MHNQTYLALEALRQRYSQLEPALTRFCRTTANATKSWGTLGAALPQLRELDQRAAYAIQYPLSLNEYAARALYWRFDGLLNQAVAAHEGAAREAQGLPATVEAKGGPVVYLPGSPVKSVANGHIGGYLVRFSTPNDPDLTGDYFTKQTDFGIKNGAKTPVWFNHRMPFKTRDGREIQISDQIGEGTLTIDDIGVFIDAVLYNRDQYKKLLASLGWSSGTASHLIDRELRGRKTAWIRRWPLGVDASLTFGPAEPRNVAVAM